MKNFILLSILITFCIGFSTKSICYLCKIQNNFKIFTQEIENTNYPETEKEFEKEFDEDTFNYNQTTEIQIFNSIIILNSNKGFNDYSKNREPENTIFSPPEFVI